MDIELGYVFADDADPLEVELTLNGHDTNSKIWSLRLFEKHLHAAILSKHCSPNSVREIVQQHPSTLNSVAAYFGTPLHIAIRQFAPVDVIHELLQLGANVNILSTELNVSPLQCVLMNTRKFDYVYKVAKLLIRYGSDLNLRGGDHQLTPFETFIKYIGDYTLQHGGIHILHDMLRKGAQLGNYSIFSKSGFFKMKTQSLRLEVLILLLEFDILPLQSVWKECSRLNCEEVKLIMQYLVVIELRNNPTKIENLPNFKNSEEIADMSHLSGSPFHEELTIYRETLFGELQAMVKDKLDENNTLFSFLSVRCSSGVTYSKVEDPVLSKIFSKFHSKHYNCCNDLFYTSFKKEDLSSILCNLCIYLKNPSHEDLNNTESVVQLNGNTILNLVSYLSRRDAIHLALAFWNTPSFKKKCSSLKISS